MGAGGVVCVGGRSESRRRDGYSRRAGYNWRRLAGCHGNSKGGVAPPWLLIEADGAAGETRILIL